MNELTTQTNNNGFAQMLAVRESSVKSHALAVDTSRAVREVEAALMVAKSRPRDELDAYKNIMQCCQRMSFAEKAIYSYKRAGENVEGPSIRLAESLARVYGNLDYGWREVERGLMKSVVEAYCWDLQNNTKRKMNFEVSHYRDTKQGKKELSSERDIYEHVANQASRRVRACILSIIPADLIEDAMNECQKTFESGVNPQNKTEYAKKIVLTFEDIGVTHEQLKRYLGVEKVIGATEKQLAELRKIYTAIKEGQATISEFFASEKKAEVVNGASKAEELIERLVGSQTL